jgi:glycosidase
MSSNSTYRTRAWSNDWFYSIVIDRFHDGKVRVSGSSEKGFGSPEELRHICGGTITGITIQLPYIKALGCTAILLSPFLENNSSVYHGYAIQDFLKVDERFGSLEDLQHLVKEAHALDLRVVMDVVLNHTGNNWSYKKTNTAYRKGRSYAFSHWHAEDKPQPAVLRNEKLYSKKGYILNWDNYPETWDGDLYELKDLVWTDDKKGHLLLDTMVDIYLYWVKVLEVDGFRLDALKHIRPVMADQFCKRIKEEVQKLALTHFILIGEVVGDASLVNSYKELDAYYNFPFYFKWNEAIKNTDVILNAFEYDFDKKRFSFNFLDNHDQIGLEPKRRIAQVLSDEAVLLNVFFLGLMPGIPCIYYGTEQGLADVGIKDHDVRSCLFDRNSDMDLCNEKTPLFVQMKAVIALVKIIKSNSTRIERVQLNNSVHLLKCFDLNDTCIYMLQYAEYEVVKVQDMLAAGVLMFSLEGKKSKEGATSFDFKVFRY